MTRAVASLPSSGADGSDSGEARYRSSWAMTVRRESRMGCRATSAACAAERALRRGVVVDHDIGRHLTHQ
jgi:hypothetical protein